MATLILGVAGGLCLFYFAMSVLRNREALGYIVQAVFGLLWGAIVVAACIFSIYYGVLILGGN